MTTETWAFHADQLWVTADPKSRARAERDQHQVILAVSSRWVRIRAGLATFFGFESNDCGAGAAAAAAHRATRIDAQRYVHRILSRRVPELIAAVPAAAEQLVASHARKRLREARVADFFQMAQLVDCAYRALEIAASQCSSAGTMETLDLVTADKSISLLSTVSTSSAAALRSAQGSLRELQHRFSMHFFDGEFPEVSDLRDLTVDLMADSTFDFTSFLSLSDFSGAESRARDAAQALRPLRQRVRELLFEQEQTLAAIRADIDSAPSVYVAKARLEIPEPLRELSRDWRS